MRTRVLLSLFSLGACVEDVPVAAECAPGERCIVELDGAVVPVGDAGKNTRVDAHVVTTRDAGVSAVDGLPPLDNLSFEFRPADSVPGDVTTVNSLTATTQIDPWYTCQPIGGSDRNSATAVRAETALAAGSSASAPKVAVGPRDGKTFVTIGPFINVVPVALLQNMHQSLVVGQTYKFAIDALATSDTAQLSLKVSGSESGCLDTQYELFRYPVTSLNWTTVCVSFTPTQAGLQFLSLNVERNDDLSGVIGAVIDPVTQIISGDPLGGPRLVLDNIRIATPAECPTP